MDTVRAMLLALGVVAPGLVVGVGVALAAPETKLSNQVIVVVLVVLESLAISLFVRGETLGRAASWVTLGLSFVAGTLLLISSRGDMVGGGLNSNSRLALGACVGVSIVTALLLVAPARTTDAVVHRGWLLLGASPGIAFVVAFEYFAYFVVWRDKAPLELFIESSLRGIMVAQCALALALSGVGERRVRSLLSPWMMLSGLNAAAGLVFGGYLITFAVGYPEAPQSPGVAVAVTWFASGLASAIALVAVGSSTRARARQRR